MEEINKFNIPGESRNKYGSDQFDDAGDDFAAAIERGGVVPERMVKPQRAEGLDEDVFLAAGDSAAKYGQ